MTDSWQGEILDFWFKDLTREDWFTGSRELDARIRDRFSPLYERLRHALVPASISDPREALAAIILFDQLPRNMFRGSAQAFESDDLAVEMARNAVDRGLDEGLSAQERQFLYMPFMHSEILADQERCVDLFRSLGDEDGLKYAIEHRDIIAKFGRFPHRNRPLGRVTSPAEQEFMEGHAGYGQ